MGTVKLFDLTDNQNRIDHRTTDTGSTGGPSTVHSAFDKNGNLTCDGVYFYQYDAWNRLVQVNRAIQQSLGGQTEPAPDGVTLLTYRWVPDGTRLLKHFTYDGLGRLIRTLSPFPGPDNNTGLRSERFYYDGVRRIQEVVADPVIAQSDAALSGDSQVMAAASAAQGASAQPLDGGATPVVVEAAQAVSPVAPSGTFLNREYVWGPGDRGVDELLCQYDWQRKPWFTLTDDGGDLVTLCDRDPTTLRGRVAAEYTYDAYGQVLTAQTYGSMSANASPHSGHKGLFVDRLDAPIVGSGNYETPRLSPLSSPLVQNRNRAYLPTLGRFLQQDPNETGATLLEGPVYHGQGPGAAVGDLRLSGLYVDGACLYQFLGSNPLLHRDPLGLTWTDMLTAETALTVLEGAQAKIGQLLVKYYAQMLIASELAYGLAQGEGNPGGASLWGTEAWEAVQAMRQFANGRFTSSLIDEFSSSTFRDNALRLWGMSGNLFKFALQAHHIIPQWGRVVTMMERLGIGNMVHNPLFSSLVSEAEHQIIHAGSGPGGWYNRMWIIGLENIERSGARGTDAGNAVVDFIRDTVIPNVRVALQRGGPPPGF